MKGRKQERRKGCKKMRDRKIYWEKDRKCVCVCMCVCVCERERHIF